MEKITYTSLRQNLSSILDNIENDREIYSVTRKKHEEIIMVAKNDYDSLLETLHLLSSKENHKKLNESILQDGNLEYEEIDL